MIPPQKNPTHTVVDGSNPANHLGCFWKPLQIMGFIYHMCVSKNNGIPNSSIKK